MRLTPGDCAHSHLRMRNMNTIRERRIRDLFRLVGVLMLRDAGVAGPGGSGAATPGGRGRSQPLSLRPADAVTAVVKTTGVMIAKP